MIYAQCYCDVSYPQDDVMCAFCALLWSEWSYNLGHSLKDAAALCKAYAQGWLACRTYDAGEDEWWPGCGRPA